MLTNRFLKHLKSHSIQDYEILNQILNINKKLHNYEFTDRILRSIYRADKLNKSLIKVIMQNLDQGSKNTVTLIPKIIFSRGSSNQNEDEEDDEMNRFGQID